MPYVSVKVFVAKRGHASPHGCLDSVECGTVEWNSGTVEWWNSGMAGWSIDDSLGHNKLISCFLDRIEVRTGSVGRQKNKNNNCTMGRVPLPENRAFKKTRN